MPLIKSISGIRGSVGGSVCDGLNPLITVRYALAFGQSLCQQYKGRVSVVLGRDGRVSGAMFENLVANALISQGIHVIVAGLSTTPSIEMGVLMHKAQGGIILTASHNPKNWNALKFFSDKGEFISEEVGLQLNQMAENDEFTFVTEDKLGSITYDAKLMERHIDAILKLPLVNADAIRKANFRIAVDAINSTGAIAVPLLLSALGVNDVYLVNGTVNGLFAHNPEPLPDHLNDLISEVNLRKAHFGIAVDPDVDRLAFITEDGEAFGEEYTLVAISDYVLSQNPGPVVSNLSSTQALDIIAERYENKRFKSSVGEVNVVSKMKEVGAVIGGEGNGGVIYPELHYGRDALVGIALFLSFLAREKKPVSFIRSRYPDYYISKNKIELPTGTKVDEVIETIACQYKGNELNREDGLRISFDKDWVHLRKSNTEPIIRIYAESDSMKKSDALASKIMMDISEIIQPRTKRFKK